MRCALSIFRQNDWDLYQQKAQGPLKVSQTICGVTMHINLPVPHEMQSNKKIRTYFFHPLLLEVVEKFGEPVEIVDVAYLLL